MVGDFLRKAKDFIGGSKDEEREENAGYRERWENSDRRSHNDRDEDEEYSGNVRRSRRDRDDDEDEDE
ncbi:hypothetical protein [Anabaena subtropica]|uniref:Uncharacterized protein n=1 Tax=Anabaena subtropica FACHB-260 TaxID=2692884 RepID=A0ABR8CPD1_9NOST|nr:hypothetical protein [Anabaena subtropica]MBD2345062.1 hypothetical protein [Anabaena subtropica FACHB-260]